MSADLAGVIHGLVAEGQFSGAIRVDQGGETIVRAAFGLADRRWSVPNEPSTRFAIASGTKGFTAVTALSLVVDGALGLDTSARSLLGDDLPLIDDDVTVEHLLAHRSGIGDYIDEDVLTDDTAYVLPVPVHELLDTEQYLAVLDGYPAKFAAGTAFSYCNGGYVVLALLLERATGTAYHELVRTRVFEPAGMADTEFLRSDELPPGAATGYLDTEGLRTNVLHLPIRGTGDGGTYTTVDDVHRFWDAWHDGRLLPAPWVEQMARPRSSSESMGMRYGLGLWLAPTGSRVMLEGADAGVSFRSVHDPVAGTTWSVVSNTTDGAWPIVKRLMDLVS